MTAINYHDFARMLFPHNFNGANDDLVSTSGVPNDQPIQQEDGKHIITYSFFKGYYDLTASGYYAPDSQEGLKILGVDEYEPDIENTYKNVIFATCVNNPQNVWFQEVANIKFRETPVGTSDLDGSGNIDQPNEYTTGHIVIGQLEGSWFPPGATARSIQYNPELFPENPDLKHGDIFYNAKDSFWDETISYKSQQFKVLLEETLHSLGVDTKTQFASGTYLDNQKYSVAAYANAEGYAPGMYSRLLGGDPVAPHTLQIMDIAALQEIYGRNYSTFSGNTDYTLAVINPTANDAAFLYTIWDGKGEDTINVSASTVAAEVDLRQGHFSSIGKDVLGFSINWDEDNTEEDPDPGNVAIAYYSIIENATGTNDADRGDILIGNAWNNVLRGLDGNDILYGDGVVYDNDAGEALWEAASGAPAAATDGSGNDTLIGGAGNDILYGGKGSDTADYSEDVLASAGVTVTLDTNGDGTATDGFGDTDTLYSIENLILTENDDNVTLDTPSGRVIDARGGDEDKVVYSALVVEDRNSGADGEVIIMDRNSGMKDTLIGVENIIHSASVVLPDYDEDVGLSSSVTYDYSAYDSDLTVHVDQECLYRVIIHGMYSNDVSYSHSAHRTTHVGVALDDGSEHSASVAFSGSAWEDNTIDARNKVMDALYDGYYDDPIEIVGSNNGDTVLLGATYSSSFSTWVTDISFTAPPVVFMAGSGDDIIGIATGTEGYITTTPDTVSLTLGYRGGDDSVTNASYLSSIKMWEGLREDEVKITELADKVVIDAGIYGSLTLNGASSAPSIIWLSETTSEVEGTWGDDNLIARAGETYNGLGGDDYIMGEGNNTITGGTGDDVVQTGLGSSVVYGHDGNDIFLTVAGGVHNDTFYGGEGSDRAVLTCNYSDYSRSGNIFTQLSGDGSSYELHDVEEVQFDDGIFDFETETHTPSVMHANSVVDDVFDVPMFSSEFSLDVLANDSSFISTIFAYQQTQHGTIVLNDEQNGFTYTPDASYEGADSFTYSIVNALGNVETATVDINVLLTGPGLGTDGDDVLVGTSGTDYIRGLDGNDTLESGGGSGDTLLGGLGWDTYVLDPATTNAVIQDVYTGDGGDVLPTSLSRLYLNNPSITFDSFETTMSVNGADLVISDGANIVAIIKDAVTFGTIVLDDGTHVSTADLHCFALNPSWGWYGETYQPTEEKDDIESSHGSIVIDLLGGNDEFVGGCGADVVFGGVGNDTLDGGGGDDVIFGGEGDDYIYGSHGIDFIDGGEGQDSLYFSYTTQGVNIDLSQGKIFNDGLGFSGEVYNVEKISGAFDNDVIIGSDSGHETIKTGYGDDILAGGAGSYDRLYGGHGNDTYLFNIGDGKDSISDYGGDLDVIKFGIGIDQSNLILTQNGNNLVITFNNSDDQLTVYNHYSTTYPYSIEKLVFFDGSETSLTGDQVNITGSALSDTLLGTDNADYIDAGDGDDVLDGGAGDDTLVGGAGDDAYLFNTGDGVNTILDTSGYDVIVLGSGITMDNLTFVQNGDDLEIQIASGFIVTDFYSGDPDKVIEGILFDDGTMFDLTSLLNTAPEAQDDMFVSDEDTVITGNVLSNDTDTENDVLTAVAQTIATANGGAVGLAADGTFTYTPADNFNGVDSFTYTVTDGEQMDTATVTLNITAVNDAPEAADDTFFGNEDEVITGNILANDSDLDGDALSVVADTIVTANGGSIVLAADGTFTYTPAANFNGIDSFIYEVSDGTVIDTGTVTLNIAPVNDGPEAANDAFVGDEDTVITGNVLTNDTDLDGDVLSTVAEIITTANGGAVELAADGTFTYTPTENFNGEDSFAYTVTDGTETRAADVTLTVNAVNDAPVAADDMFEGEEDTTIIGNLLIDSGVDNDPDNDVLSVIAGTYATSHGTVVVQEGGNFIYTPDVNYSGTDSFEYSVTDGVATDTAQVSLNIAPVNDAPEALDDSFTGDQDVVITGNVLANDTDLDGDALGVASGAYTTTHGSVFVEENGNFTYTPDASYVGEDSFTYTVTDGQGGESSAIVTLTLESLSNNAIIGTDGTDFLYGSNDADVIYGEGGWDYLFGYGGDDELHGGSGRDLINGGSGNDHLYGDDGRDYLYGGFGNDVLEGGAGNDVLLDTFGSDTFIIGEGKDLVGSSGNDDTFVFNAMDDQVDRIFGFSTGADGDTLDISNILNGYDPLSDAITDFVQITENWFGSYLSVDVDGGADNFVQIACLYGTTGLTNEEALETTGDLVTV